MRKKLMWAIIIGLVAGTIPAIIYHMGHQHDHPAKTAPSSPQ